MTNWRTSLLITGGQLTQQVTIFFGLVLVARQLGPDDYGLYSLLRTMYTMLVILLPLGLDLVLTKHGGIAGRQGLDFNALSGRLRLLSLLAGGALLFCYLFFADTIGVIVSSDITAYHALIVLTLLAAMAGADLQLMSAVLRARERPDVYALVALYAVSIVRFALIAGGVAAHAPLVWFLWANLIALLLGVALLFFYDRLARRRSALTRAGTSVVPFRQILAEAAWMLLSQIQYGVVRFLDVMAVGALVSARSAGEYATMSMIAQVIQIYPGAMAATIGSRISGLMAEDRRAEVSDLLKDYLLKASRIGGFLFAGIAAFGNKLDLLFGVGFTFPASLALALALGWFVSALYAPAGFVMSMAGWHRLESAIILSGSAILVLGLAVLVPSFEGTGAALAILASFVWTNAGRILFIRYRQGVEIHEGRHFHAPILYLVLGTGLSLATEWPPLRNLPSVVLACVLYAIAVALLTYAVLFSEAERRAVHRLIRRILPL